GGDAPNRRPRRDARARRPRRRPARRCRPRGGKESNRAAVRGRQRRRGRPRGGRRRRRHVGRSRAPLRDERSGRRRGGSDRPARRRGPRQGIARRENGSRRRSAQGGAPLMLYHLLFPFHAQVPVLNVTRYITFRTAAASLTALAISLVLGPWMVRKLREFQIGQVIRAEGPQTHKPKAGTPTM